MRVTLAIVIAVITTQLAYAQLVILGPAAPDDTKPSLVDDVRQAIDRANLGKRETGIGPSCAVDTTCIHNTASGLAAQRAMAISITQGNKVTIELVLVDVAANELIGKRQLEVAANRIDRELGAMLRKFIDEAAVERAKEHFTRGNQHYALGEMQAALVAYKRAYQLKPLAEFLFNVGQCHRKLGQHQEAITMYQQYLVGVPEAENRALVEDLIAESRAAIAAGESAEQKRTEDLRRAREAEALAAAERRRAEEARAGKSIWPWVAIGIGAAAIVGGGILYATSETDDGTQPTYRDSRPAGIGIGIGGAALVGAGVLWITVF